MRQIGTVGTRPEAERLSAYLLTRGIRSQIDADGNRFAVWVFDEDQLAKARDDFARFVENPTAPEFVAAEEAATAILDEQLRQRRNQPALINLRDRWDRPAAASQPVTMLFMVASIGITFLSGFGGTSEAARENRQVVELVDRLKIATPQATRYENQMQGLSEIRDGQVWRLVTPIFLHFNIQHILFNMMWLYDLGMLVEFRRGQLRMIMLVLLIAIFSNLCQYWWKGSMNFGGMSGVIYGLVGYTWMKSRYYPRLALYLSPNTIIFSIIFLIICMVGWMGPIANAAHLGGFAIGILLGLIPFL